MARFQATNFQLGKVSPDLGGLGQAFSNIGAQATNVVAQQTAVRTAEDEAVAAAGLKAYQAEFSNDALEEITRIRDENIDNPDGFESAISGYKAGLGYVEGKLTSGPEAARPGVERLIDNLETRARIKVDQTFRTKTAEDSKRSAQSNITLSNQELTKAIRAQDAESVVMLSQQIEEMLDSPAFDTDEAIEIAENIRQGAFLESTTEPILTSMLAGDRLNAFKKMTDLRMDGPPKGVSVEAWDKHLDGIRQEVQDLTDDRKRLRDELDKSVAVERAFAKSDLDAMADSGTLSDEMIQAAWNKGTLQNENEIVSLRNKNRKANVAKVDDSNVFSALEGDNSFVLDTGAVNRVYDEIGGDFSPKDKAEFVDSTKVVPKQMRNEVDSQLLSGDNTQAETALKTISQIDQIPGMIDPFSNQTRAFADLVVNFSQNMDPQDAIKLARDLTNPSNKAMVEARAVQFKDLTTGPKADDLNVESIVERGFLGIDVEPSKISLANMQVEYSGLTEGLFSAGMDFDSAKSKAASIMARNWKEQNFLGRNEAFKYPLMDYYPVEGSIDYLERQLLHDTDDMFGGEISKENIFLISDTRTANEAALKKPTYKVLAIDDNGNILSGFRFVPDRQEGIKQRDKRQAKERLESIDRSKKSKDVRSETPLDFRGL